MFGLCETRSHNPKLLSVELSDIFIYLHNYPGNLSPIPDRLLQDVYALPESGLQLIWHLDRQTNSAVRFLQFP